MNPECKPPDLRRVQGLSTLAIFKQHLFFRAEGYLTEKWQRKLRQASAIQHRMAKASGRERLPAQLIPHHQVNTPQKERYPVFTPKLLYCIRTPVFVKPS